MAYRVALIGCGMISHAHAYGWRSSGRGCVVALADRSDAALAELARTTGVDEQGCYTDFRAMLDDHHPDIVVVALWHRDHAEAVLAAASRGAKLVVCEKPMAPSLGDAEAMMVACRRVGARLAVAHQRRFYPGWDLARNAVLDGTIGTPLSACTKVRDGLLNNGTHAIDLARYVLGDPAAVRAVGAVHRDSDRYERGLAAEDSSIGLVEFEGGVRLHIDSDLDHTAVLSANLTILGTEGALRIEENCVEVLNTRAAGWQRLSGVPLGTDHDDERLETAPIRAMVPHFGTVNGEQFADNFTRQAHALAHWLDHPDSSYRGDAAEGYATLEIIMALYESARLREVTTFPLRTRSNPLELMISSGALTPSRPGRYDIRSMLVRGESMSW